MSSPFGGETRTRVLVALRLLDESYPRELARLLGVSLPPSSRRSEASSVTDSWPCGRLAAPASRRSIHATSRCASSWRVPRAARDGIGFGEGRAERARIRPPASRRPRAARSGLGPSASPSRRDQGVAGRDGALGALLAVAVMAGSGTAASQTWSGFVETRGFAYADRTSERDPWVVGWATAQGTVEQRVSASLRLSATLRTEVMSTGDRDLFLDLADRDLRRTAISLREAWVSWSVAPTVDVEAGRFLLGWGKTDGYSPADAFLPRDLTDPFADEKLPLWGLRTRGQAGALRFDGVFVPLGTPWRVPVSSPRFAPVDSTVAGLPVVLVDGENDLPRTGWGALRLLATFGDWDVGAWGRTGIRPAPLLTPDPTRPSSTAMRSPFRPTAATPGKTPSASSSRASPARGSFGPRGPRSSRTIPGSATRSSGPWAPSGPSATGLSSSRSPRMRAPPPSTRSSSSTGPSSRRSSPSGSGRSGGEAGVPSGRRAFATATAS